MFKRDVLLAIHNFSEVSLANNAKIISSLKFLLTKYMGYNNNNIYF